LTGYFVAVTEPESLEFLAHAPGLASCSWRHARPDRPGPFAAPPSSLRSVADCPLAEDGQGSAANQWSCLVATPNLLVDRKKSRTTRPAKGADCACACVCPLPPRSLQYSFGDSTPQFDTYCKSRFRAETDVRLRR